MNNKFLNKHHKQVLQQIIAEYGYNINISQRDIAEKLNINQTLIFRIFAKLQKYNLLSYQYIDGGANKIYHINPDIVNYLKTESKSESKTESKSESKTESNSKTSDECIKILESLKKKICKEFTRRGFAAEFKSDLLECLNEKQFQYISDIFYGDIRPQDIVFGPELFIFLHHYTQTTDNETITSRPIKSSSEDDDTDDDGFKVDLNLMGDALAGYRQDKKKQSLPFFPADEVEEFVSDIRNCLDRADKIYINQVWEIAHECYDMDEIYDDEGELVAEASSNIENIGVHSERLMKDILLPAFDQTQEIIEKGRIEVDGEEYEITATIDNADDFENIIDWETVVLPDGINYVISMKRVRNIFGNKVRKVSHRPTREEVADSMEYMRKIISLGDDDGRYSELTPIELAVYNFLAEHFKISESGEVEEPKNRIVNKTQLKMFYYSMKQKGLSENDFISVLSVDKPDMHECLSLRPCMFRASKIRRWNELHAYPSVVDGLS